jgi:hypothetical protein
VPSRSIRSASQSSRWPRTLNLDSLWLHD